jgi:hypothetical protein
MNHLGSLKYTMVLYGGVLVYFDGTVRNTRSI